MLKNLNEKDKKKILSLLSLSVVCIIALGILSWPGLMDKDKTKKVEGKKSGESEITQKTEENNLEGKLKKILSQIDGAGEVDVMITFESSEEIQPAFNSNQTTEKTEEKDAQGGERTVTTSSDNKTMITSQSNSPVVIKTTEPKIKGVIVVASGANDPIVKETLYSAVQTSLQVAGHQVEVYNK